MQTNLPESLRTDFDLSLPLSPRATAEVKLHSTMQQLRLNELRKKRAKEQGKDVSSLREHGNRLEDLARAQIAKLQ